MPRSKAIVGKIAGSIQLYTWNPYPADEKQ